MSDSNNKKIFKYLDEIFRKKGVNNIIVCESVKNRFGEIIEGANYYFDSRGAAYAAIGQIMETNKPSVVFSLNDNDSRNCYSAITEAHYHQLPLIFVSISDSFFLNYEIEIKDTSSQTVDLNVNDEKSVQKTEDAIDFCIKQNLPIHIIIHFTKEAQLVKRTNVYDDFLISLMKPTNYIFIGESLTSLISSPEKYKHNLAGGIDGVISNVVGASLSHKYEKYYCFCTCEELLHDLGVFGNREIGQQIFICLIDNYMSKTIEDYVTEFGFKCFYGASQYNEFLKSSKGLIFLEE